MCANAAATILKVILGSDPPRRYLFADESGNFDFTGGRGASRYFILTTIALDDCSVGDRLLALRRELAWEGVGLDAEFHATTDPLLVRDRVFAALERETIRVDATIIEKATIPDTMRDSDLALYEAAWAAHLRRVLPTAVAPGDELLVIGASLGTRRRRGAFREAIVAAISASDSPVTCRVASWLAASDPCLQVADYCSWAIQRAWERGDERPRSRIATRLASEQLVPVTAADTRRNPEWP